MMRQRSCSVEQKGRVVRCGKVRKEKRAKNREGCILIHHLEKTAQFDLKQKKTSINIPIATFSGS